MLQAITTIRIRGMLVISATLAVSAGSGGIAQVRASCPTAEIAEIAEQ